MHKRAERRVLGIVLIASVLFTQSGCFHLMASRSTYQGKEILSEECLKQRGDIVSVEKGEVDVAATAKMAVKDILMTSFAIATGGGILFILAPRWAKENSSAKCLP